MAACAKRIDRYFCYSGGDFEGFAQKGDTLHQRGSLFQAKFHPTSAGVGVWAPKLLDDLYEIFIILGALRACLCAC